MKQQDVATRIAAWLASPTPRVEAAEAEALALEQFGIQARASVLLAERDRNFRLDGPQGPGQVLKIHTAHANPAELAFQNRALQHAERVAPELPFPRLLPNLDGADMTHWQAAAGSQHCVRLLSWQPGKPVDFNRADAELRRATGRLLADSQAALADCPVQDAPTDLPWDLLNYGTLEALLPTVEDPALRAACAATCRRFVEEVDPALKDLPRQVVHNDFNPDNILEDGHGRLTGVIDFGDMVVAPPLCDLAIACSYQLDGGEGLHRMEPLIEGYSESQPFRAEDRWLLEALVECRLASSILIQCCRQVQHPDNAAYFENGLEIGGRRLLQAINAGRKGNAPPR